MTGETKRPGEESSGSLDGCSAVDRECNESHRVCLYVGCIYPVHKSYGSRFLCLDHWLDNAEHLYRRILCREIGIPVDADVGRCRFRYPSPSSYPEGFALVRCDLCGYERHARWNPEPLCGRCVTRHLAGMESPW